LKIEWLVVLRDVLLESALATLGTITKLVAMLTGGGLSLVVRRNPGEPAPPAE
jgi:hypothetical protein